MRTPHRHGASHVCLHAIPIRVFIRRDTARYRTKGYNGSNSHPKAGLSWPMAYPYSPMLPSVLAVVNVEGAHTGTTTDPLRSHPTPTALPQELHRCDLESPHSQHNRRRAHAPPSSASIKEDVNTSPPTFPAHGRHAYVSPIFSCSKETANTSPPARHSANWGGASLLLLDLYILVLQRITLVLNARVAAVASFLVFHEHEPPSSIMHLGDG